jgi:DtxR family Mn-dependent transcriptional regulator
MLSYTEENYLKAIFKISFDGDKGSVGTNELAATLSVKPATANVMLKKLRGKEFVYYEKYGKITLTSIGKKKAIDIVRKHRLWETFLYEKLGFTWDEVHEVAEQLEHIQSEKLIDKLDKFLNFPKVDPHGDPIPNRKGEIKAQPTKTLADIEQGGRCRIVAVKDNSSEFLQYAVTIGLEINSEITVLQKLDDNADFTVEINRNKSIISNVNAVNILVLPLGID